jgi:hypothetical protein
MTSNYIEITLPNVNINDMNLVLNIGQKDLIQDFNKSASKKPSSRVKLNILDQNKCNHPNCIKYASYKYLLETINLCWFHAYTYQSK